MPPLPLSEVRSRCGWVARRAASVRVRAERIGPYAAELERSASFRPALDPRAHHLGRGEETLAFVVCLNAVNFGSGWFPWLVERPGPGGYFTIATALTERFARGGPPAAAELAAMDGAACAEIFGQTAAPAPVGELMSHFAAAWRQLGRYLLERFDGSPGALVTAAAGSAERLVALLAAMPAFDDVAVYGGRRVPFYKRGQLLATDLALAFSHRGPGRFDDLDRLTLFADNQVPQVLRADGVLELAGPLAEAIDAGREIAAGSPEEVEIRAAAVHAVELLAAETERRGAPRLPWELDQALWNRGLGAAYAKPPPHRTRTIFY